MLLYRRRRVDTDADADADGTCLEMAMSAFWTAILDARFAALSAESIRSRNLAERMRKRCRFWLLVMSTLFLYLPSSMVPSGLVVTP